MKTVLINKATKSSETLKTIYGRRSVRKYKDIPVNNEVIDQVLDAGRMAPSAINRQPWKFYVLTKKETIQSLSKEIGKIAGKEFLKIGPKQILKAVGHLLHYPHDLRFFKGEYFIFHGAPVVIFITGPRDNEWAPLDIGMCSQNIMLAAKSLGLDSCPVGMGKYAEQTKNYSQLHIPSTEQIYLSIVLGYGDEKPEMPKRTRDNIVYIDRMESW
ncbi:MAG: nitroreductase [Bacteroidota bacterium]|nr:nitroreductase [Bacteroidota bacterium]